MQQNVPPYNKKEMSYQQSTKMIYKKSVTYLDLALDGVRCVKVVQVSVVFLLVVVRTVSLRPIVVRTIEVTFITHLNTL